MSAAVAARDLTRRFGAFTAVDRVSFEVERGEIFGYLGANGAGKSTTIRMLIGLVAPSEGTASVAGHDVATARDAVKASIGYMSQRFSLYLDLPVAENLAFFGAAYGLEGRALRVRAGELLERVGLAGSEDQITGDLPGGLRQRLALASALLHAPPVVFLDEPTAGMDPAAKQATRERIAALRDAGCAVIWLECPVEELLARCATITNRPLFRDEASFRQLYERRLPFYEQADFRVDGTAEPRRVVEQILAMGHFESLGFARDQKESA